MQKVTLPIESIIDNTPYVEMQIGDDVFQFKKLSGRQFLKFMKAYELEDKVKQATEIAQISYDILEKCVLSNKDKFQNILDNAEVEGLVKLIETLFTSTRDGAENPSEIQNQ